MLNTELGGKQLIKPVGERPRQAEKRVKQVFAKVVKRDKSATKTLKKSNREQHTGRVWKRTGIRQGNVIGFGYLQDCQRTGNAADGFSQRKRKRKRSFCRPSARDRCSWRSLGYKKNMCSGSFDHQIN